MVAKHNRVVSLREAMRKLSGGGPAESLGVRRFGPGHFIADATLGAGDWQIDVAATASDGAIFQARFPVHLR